MSEVQQILPMRPPSTGVKFHITQSENIIMIEAEGYGNCYSEGPAGDGSQTILLLEYYEGKLQALAWTDVNEQDPTHIINFEDAKEDKRRD